MALTGKVAIITGCASGIGRAMARTFCAQGASVLAVDLDEAALAKVVGGLSDAGHDARSIVANVADKAQIDAMIDKAIESWGRLDVLVNNAGVLDDLTPLHDVSDDLWDKVLGVNITGPFLACRRALPIMIEAGGGAIVNTASAAGEHGGRGGAAYTASKHALIGLTRSMAWFYGPKGVRCNAVAPGAIMTKMHGRMQPHGDGFARYQPYFPLIPPMGKAADVAAAAAFLASDEAKYVNGTVLAVDGGWTAY